MQLNGKTRKQFHEALLSAFPTPAKLKQMVSFELDENLDAISTGNYSDVVTELILWAESGNKKQIDVEQLLTAARSANPGNTKLRSFEEQIRGTPNVNATPVKETSGNVSTASQTGDFDVFLAHNSLDKPQVRAIAKELEKRGIKYWLDEQQIPPGRWFQDVIQQAIPNVKSAVILIGVNALGRWQKVELRSLISQCVEADIPVIGVLLPGVNNIPENLLFLKELNWVRFSQDIDEKEVLDSLEWGITGIKPLS